MWFSHQLVMMISNHELTLRLVETEIPKMVLLGPNSDCFLSAYAILLFIHPFFSRTPDSGQPASTLQKGWSSVVGVQGQIHGYTVYWHYFFQQFQFSHNLQASYTVFSPNKSAQPVTQCYTWQIPKVWKSGTGVFCFPSNGIGSTSHGRWCQVPETLPWASGLWEMGCLQRSVELDLGGPWERIVKSISWLGTP